jgi:hypothetical protein
VEQGKGKGDSPRRMRPEAFFFSPGDKDSVYRKRRKPHSLFPFPQIGARIHFSLAPYDYYSLKLSP